MSNDRISPSFNWKNVVGLEPELSQMEKDIRDRFVSEYLVDYNALKAAQRMGYMWSYAKEFATSFMQESYVQKKISDYERSLDIDIKDNCDNVRKRAVLNLVRQSEYYGPGATHAGRVLASCKIIEYCNEADKMRAESKNNNQLRGGVMRVPALVSIDEWEQAAIVSQEKLLRETNEV